MAPKYPSSTSSRREQEYHRSRYVVPVQAIARRTGALQSFSNSQPALYLALWRSNCSVPLSPAARANRDTSSNSTIRPDPPSSRHSSSPSSTFRRSGGAGGGPGHSTGETSYQRSQWPDDEYYRHTDFLVNRHHTRPGNHETDARDNLAAFDNMWRGAGGGSNSSSRTNSAGGRSGASRDSSRGRDDGTRGYSDDHYYHRQSSGGNNRRHDGGGSGGAAGAIAVSSQHRGSANSSTSRGALDSHTQRYCSGPLESAQSPPPPK